MNYFELLNNEYILKKDISNFDEKKFNDEYEKIKDETKIYINPILRDSFITPIHLLIWTFAAVAVTSIIVIAFGILLETHLLYIPLGIAWAIWITLVVIVILERKKKSTFLNNPKIYRAVMDDETVHSQKGLFINYNINYDGEIKNDVIFLKTNLSSKKSLEDKKELYEECLERKNFMVIVYNDNKKNSYPIKLFLN